MPNLPKITEQYLKSISSSNSFSKGLAYYKNQAVINPVQDGLILRAEVRGSEYQPYRVNIIFDAEALEDANCTCPYDYGGYCKHQIAVILQYIHKPESFVVQTALAELLANHSREELIKLIERLLDREPDLYNLLSMPIAGKSAATKPISLEGYQRELQRHINNYDENALIRSINSIVRNAQDFAKAGDYANATKIYGCIIEETIDDGNFEDWSEGEILDSLSEVLMALVDCMNVVKDDAVLRRSILSYWLKAVVLDLLAGGIGFADEGEDWVTSYAQAEDIPFIRPILEKASKKAWSQEYVEDFLEHLDLIEGKDPEASYQRMLEKGLYGLYFDKMLNNKRLDAALAVWGNFEAHERAKYIPILASAGYHTEALKFAEEEIHKDKNKPIIYWLLTEYERQNEHEKAVKLAEALLKGKDSNWLLTWLIGHYERLKNPEKVLAWNRQRFQAEPTIEHYSALKTVAQSLQQWESIETEILKEVQKNHVLLTQIHMLEKRWLAAWENLELALKNLSQNYSFYGNGVRAYGLDLELAEAASKATPEKSIAIYLKYARKHIDQRQRTTYAEAAEYLKKIQDIYLHTLGDTATWRSLIDGLRQEFRNLPAMQDEFKKAGLYK